MECNSLMSPLISIVTVCLNNKMGLLKTHKSICSQIFDDFEWIVLDGMSTDGTLNFLEQLPESKKIKWFSSSDEGLYDAMNKGISLSTGKYLIFLNSGDEFSSNKVLSLVNELCLKHCFDFIYGDANEVTKAGSVLLKKAFSHNKIWYGMFTHHQAMFFRRRILVKNRVLYNLQYTISADYAFVSEFLSKARKLYYTNNCICNFEQGGVSELHIHKALHEQWLIRKNILKIQIIFRFLIHIVHKVKLFIRFSTPFIYKKIRYR